MATNAILNCGLTPNPLCERATVLCEGALCCVMGALCCVRGTVLYEGHCVV